MVVLEDHKDHPGHQVQQDNLVIEVRMGTLELLANQVIEDQVECLVEQELQGRQVHQGKQVPQDRMEPLDNQVSPDGRVTMGRQDPPDKQERLDSLVLQDLLVGPDLQAL
jgi:hypothetical protein